MNGMHEYFVFLHVCVQAETPFIFFFTSVGDERVEVPARRLKNTYVYGIQSLQIG
jgi:hypothetical protein